MKIAYHLNLRLPPLSWVATLDWARNVLNVTHGSSVETSVDCFFEGAWAGDFTTGRPDATEVVFGSGAVLSDAVVCFVPSLATTDYLYYRLGVGVLTVANSLALLLAQLGDCLDASFEGYAEINNTILNGIATYRRDIPTRHGIVHRLMHNNLVSESGTITEVPKPFPPEFASYEAYTRYLTVSYGSLIANARDASRRTPLNIYSTQSRGYDSTAINSIAARFVLDGVFTVTTGKGAPGRPDVDDDGSEIARVLGITNIIAIERHAFEKEFDDELYYHASMHECQDANLKGVSRRIKAPALLLTGTLGELWYTDAAWYHDRPETLNSDLTRGDLGTHGLTEVRLRGGYVQAAIPYIGARRRSEILRISESDEMARWRLNNAYDRPIPRRLGEEAGVRRTDFGQVKIGSVVEWPPPQTPRDRTLRSEYYHFLRTNGLRNRVQVILFPAVQRLNSVLWTARETNHRAVYYAMRGISKIIRRDIQPRVFWSRFRGSLFCFAVNKCAIEYTELLRTEP